MKEIFSLTDVELADLRSEAWERVLGTHREQADATARAAAAPRRPARARRPRPPRGRRCRACRRAAARAAAPGAARGPAAPSATVFKPPASRIRGRRAARPRAPVPPRAAAAAAVGGGRRRQGLAHAADQPRAARADDGAAPRPRRLRGLLANRCCRRCYSGASAAPRATPADCTGRVRRSLDRPRGAAARAAARRRRGLPAAGRARGFDRRRRGAARHRRRRPARAASSSPGLANPRPPPPRAMPARGNRACRVFCA